jgi:hypothetical protein
MDENASSVKLSSVIFWIVDKFVSNKKYYYWWIYWREKRAKKIIRFIPSVFLSGSLSYNWQKYRMQFRRWLFKNIF